VVIMASAHGFSKKCTSEMDLLARRQLY